MKKYVIVILLFVLSCSVYSQPKQNSIYFEALGNGGLYSFNYDRMFTESLGGRIGFMYLSELDFIFTSINDLLLIPITLNYFVGSGNSKLELGGGIVYVSVSGGEFFGIKSSNKSSSNAAGTATIGYRYQQSSGGFLFRIGFTPFFNSGGFAPSSGISFGFSF
jgi:hypothetical protein